MVRPEGCNHTRHDEVVFVQVGNLAEPVRCDALARQRRCREGAREEGPKEQEETGVIRKPRGPKPETD